MLVYNLINIVTKTRLNKMRFSNTLIVIASLSAAAKADLCLAEASFCSTDDECCDELVCFYSAYPSMCVQMKTKQNENGADVGEPCDVNGDCTSGWCNIHSIPHVCGAVDAIDVNGKAVGEECDTNGDCTSGWCNIHSIPHVCGATDEKDGGVVKQLLEVFQ